MTGLIVDRRPKNSSEKFMGHAHFLCCPRLRLLISKKSETVQFAVRDTKDCFHLYEVLLSCQKTKVIGPRTSRSWLEHVDHEMWDVR